jgi:excisionase family DNA binding protein
VTTVERLLTAAEAAEVLHVGRSKVYELMAGGLLRSVKIGRCRRVTLAALRDYLAELEGAET